MDAGGLPDLSGFEIVIASDVQNPLTGPTGAAAVYGPPKGATPEQVEDLDAGLRHLVTCLTDACPTAGRLAASAGVGAAGGLGFAGTLLGGRAVSGADCFLDLLQFETHLEGCDLVIIGEGRIDDQTLHGKLPAIVARRTAPVPAIAIVGRSDISERARHVMGLSLLLRSPPRPADGRGLTTRSLRTRRGGSSSRFILAPRSPSTARSGPSAVGQLCRSAASRARDTCRGVANRNDPHHAIRQIDDYRPSSSGWASRHEVYRFDAGPGRWSIEETIRQVEVALDSALRHVRP